ncbi:proton-coupled zinc antiporter SLC30A2-like isoform X2 [Stegostoma tigrinum]|uniref:proton-coupled zinc antiporter SLC30A2-like isoform X2 n=1 Tax=Stegostoma tigrinum TaxID=3053191 RepID=UPI00202AD5D4|nr:proton-coupled zinc antiporter SLC30A2-like isoform X2 [Stegostoma tigrinum]
MDEMRETSPLLKNSLVPRSSSSAGTSLEGRETLSTKLHDGQTRVDPVLEQLEPGHCHSSQSSGDHKDVDKEIARRRLYLASAVCLVFIISEVIDFATMLVSLFSLWISSRPATKTMNFGWHRSEILGALVSVLSIWVVTGVLVYLAVERLISGQYEIKGGAMVITSGGAVAVNIVMGIILHQSGHNHSHGSTGEVRSQDIESNANSHVNASVRAAFIHVVGDLLQSVGVLIAAYIIYFKPEYKIVDPICTFLFSILVLGTTISILRDVLCILMEGTPKGMDFNQVKQSLLLIDGVKTMHSLHIWALTINQPLLSVHIAIDEDANAQEILAKANHVLQSKFDFHSITIQIENYSDDMVNCRECQEPRD